MIPWQVELLAEAFWRDNVKHTMGSEHTRVTWAERDEPTKDHYRDRARGHLAKDY